MKLTIIHTAEVTEMPASCAECPFCAKDVCNLPATDESGMFLRPSMKKRRATGCPLTSKTAKAVKNLKGAVAAFETGGDEEALYEAAWKLAELL